MVDIIDGLTYLHSLGVTHRDIVPRNFLNNDAGPVIVCDLECHLATYKAPELTVMWPNYTPDSAFTPESDVYALGWCLKLL